MSVDIVLGLGMILKPIKQLTTRRLFNLLSSILKKNRGSLLTRSHAGELKCLG